MRYGTTTAYRYVAEAVGILAALAPPLAEAVRAASGKTFVVLDGTLLPVDRIAADRPFCSPWTAAVASGDPGHTRSQSIAVWRLRSTPSTIPGRCSAPHLPRTVRVTWAVSAGSAGRRPWRAGTDA